MATRATYSIKNSRSITTTLYIHWDGYLEGAAAYFYAALTNVAAIESNGGFAEQIIRAVPGAELTHGPEAHGDTEFHYEIGADMSLRALRWTWKGNQRSLTPCFIGDVYSFVNRYNEQIEDFKPFKPVTRKFAAARWMNADTAKHDLESRSGALRHLRIWSTNPQISRESANWQNCVEQLRNMIEAFPELMTEEIQGFLA